MRHPAPLTFGLVAACIALTGCGRVSSTQVAKPALTGAAAKKAAGATDGGGTSGRAPTVNMMATGVGAAKGQVIDKATGRPLAGITIVAKAAGLRATTDANGAFVIAGLTGGNHEFEVQHAGLVMEMPAGTLVMPNQTADVPVIALVPGAGKSGVTSVSYVKEKELGRDGEAPATLIDPVGVATQGADVRVLDRNHSAFVKTGVVRQYDAEAGKFEGKFGDYSKWLGFSQMKNTVTSIAVDSQGRTVVLDGGARKLWRFAEDGDKEKAADLAVDATDIATDLKTGSLLVAGASGINKLTPDGDNPQPVGSLADCVAVAGGKDGIWAIAGGKVTKLAEDGNAVLEFGAGGTEGGANFSEAVDLAVDPRNGHVVVVDKGAKQVYVYDPMGTLIGKVGQGVFEQPVAVTVDAGGRVYVVDQAKKKVYKFLPGVTR